MRDTLYVQLRDAAPDAPLAYALASAQPGVGVQVQQATLEAILALAGGRRVVLFVPGADVRLTAVKVPARTPQRILQAAPYALENRQQLLVTQHVQHRHVQRDQPERGDDAQR